MKLFGLFLSVFLPFAALAGICHFPQSGLQIEAATGLRGISQAQFNAAITLVDSTWGGVVKAQGATLVFKRLWSDSTVNSDTDVEGSSWVINSYGGLARYPGMTQDGYVLVACHELGHHLGGAPRFSGDPWASVEGEADYFATLQCAKATLKSPARIAAASQVLANVLASLGGEKRPSPGTPDRTIVKVTYEDHPAAQCRLDTYLSGLKCNAAGGLLSPTDPKVNACVDGAGARPLCWYKP